MKNLTVEKAKTLTIILLVDIIVILVLGYFAWLANKGIKPLEKNCMFIDGIKTCIASPEELGK